MEQKRYSKSKLRLFEWRDTTKDNVKEIAAEFVECLFNEMANLSVKLNAEKYGICDMPYLYSERRLDCVIMPALSKICNGLVMDEVPTKRRNRSKKVEKKTSQGRIDYWCIFKGYSFVIEVKQSFDGFRGNDHAKRSTKELWKEMIVQLKTVKDDVKYYVEKTEKVIRLGILFVASYTYKDDPDKNLSVFNKRIPTISNYFFNELGTGKQIPKPDMMMLWQIPDKIVLNEKQLIPGTFPGLWAIVSILDSIDHKGATY